MSVRGCYQGVIGCKAAENRLRETNVDFSFLTRESDIKKGKFILSWLTKDGSVKHTAAPNPSARNNFQKFEDALSVLEKMIESNDECVNPVPPRGNDISDENNNSVDYESPSEHACYACDFVASHLRELRDHERKHTVSVLIVTRSFTTRLTEVTLSDVRRLPMRSTLVTNVTSKLPGSKVSAFI